MLLQPMVCSAWLLVVGGQVQDSRVCVQEFFCMCMKLDLWYGREVIDLEF